MKTTFENQLNATEIYSSEELLQHWQNHRALTRRVIEVFPEEEFFTYRIGGMRPFAEMVMEMIGMSAPAVREIATGDREKFDENLEHGTSKKKLLHIWDETTEQINIWWPQIRHERFQEVIILFGMYEYKAIESILYMIDNEIHHRGQGYVYLRSLGVEPPPFYDYL